MKYTIWMKNFPERYGDRAPRATYMGRVDADSREEALRKYEALYPGLGTVHTARLASRGMSGGK